MSEKHELSLKIMGLDALPSFKFNYSDHNMLKTFLTQEFLKKGFLASTTIYLSVYHSKKLLINMKKFWIKSSHRYQMLKEKN